MAGAAAMRGSPAPRRETGLARGVAASATLHAALLGAAILWQFQAGGERPAGLVVEVAFIEGHTPTAAASAASPTPVDAPPVSLAAVAPPVEVPPVESPLVAPRAAPSPPAPVDPAPAAVPPPAPTREVVLLPLPTPPRPRPPTPTNVAPTLREAAPSIAQLASAAPLSDMPAPSAEPDVAAASAAAAGTAQARAAVQQAAAEAAQGLAIVTNPRFRARPTPPAYPRRAIDLGQEGEVVIRALVGPDGESREIRLWRSSGIAALDEAALRAVRRWAFEAARVDGRPIEAWVEVPVRFQLRSVL